MAEDKTIIWSPGLLLAPFVKQPQLQPQPTDLRSNPYLQTLFNRQSTEQYDPVNSQSSQATTALSKIGQLDTLLTDKETTAQQFLAAHQISLQLTKPSWLFSYFELHPRWLEPIDTFVLEKIEFLKLKEVPLIKASKTDEIIGGTFQLANGLLGWAAIPPQIIKSEEDLFQFIKQTEDDIPSSSGLVRLSIPLISSQLITITNKLSEVNIKSFTGPISQSIIINNFSLDNDNVNKGTIKEYFNREDEFIYPPADFIIKQPFVLAFGLPSYGIVWAIYLPAAAWNYHQSESLSSYLPSFLSKSSTGLKFSLIYSPIIPFLSLYEANIIQPQNPSQTLLLQQIIEPESNRFIAAINNIGQFDTFLGPYNQVLNFTDKYSLSKMIKPNQQGIYAVTVFNSHLQLQAAKSLSNKYLTYQINSVKSWKYNHQDRGFLISLTSDINLLLLPNWQFNTREDLVNHVTKLNLLQIEESIDSRFDIIVPAFTGTCQIELNALNGLIMKTKSGSQGPIIQTLVDYCIKVDGQVISGINVESQSFGQSYIFDRAFVMAIISKQIGLILTMQIKPDNFRLNSATETRPVSQPLIRSPVTQQQKLAPRTSHSESRSRPDYLANNLSRLLAVNQSSISVAPLNQLPVRNLTLPENFNQSEAQLIEWLNSKIKVLLNTNNYHVIDIKRLRIRALSLGPLSITIEYKATATQVNFLNNSPNQLYIAAERIDDNLASSPAMDFFSLAVNGTNSLIWSRVTKFRLALADNRGIIQVSSIFSI